MAALHDAVSHACELTLHDGACTTKCVAVDADPHVEPVAGLAAGAGDMVCQRAEVCAACVCIPVSQLTPLTAKLTT